jgi:hypothetical protein
MCDDRAPRSRSHGGHGYGDNHGTAGRCADRTPIAYDSPTRLIEWLTDRIAERGYAR